MQLAFPRLDAAVLSFTKTAKSGAGAVATLKAGFSGLGSALVAHPLMLGAVAIGAVTTAAALLQKHIDSLKQKTQEIIEEYQNQNDKLADAKDRLDELIPKYETLSAGVDEHNKNVALTDEQYSEYLQICNELGELFPTLIKGFDDQGNAILNCKGNVEQLTGAYNDMVAAANNAVISQAKTVVSSFNWDLALKFTENEEGYGLTPERVDLLKQILSSEDIDSAVDELTNRSLRAVFAQEFKDNGLKKQSGESDAEFIKRTVRENKVIVEAIISEFDQEVESSLQGYRTLTEAYLDNVLATDSRFSGLSAENKSKIKELAQNLGIEFYKNFGNVESYSSGISKWLDENWMDAITPHYDVPMANPEALIPEEEIKEQAEKAAESIKKTFSEIFDSENDEGNAFGDYLDDYVDNVTKLKEALSKFQKGELEPEDLIELQKTFPELSTSADKFESSVVSLIATMREGANTELDAAIDGIVDEEDLAKVDELRSGINSVAEVSYEAAEAVKNLSTSLDDIEKSKDILESAGEEMAENGEISTDTLKSIIELMDAGENYLDYLDIENGKIKLNTPAWEERAATRLADRITELADERAELEKENEVLEENIAKLAARDFVLSGGATSSSLGITPVRTKAGKAVPYLLADGTDISQNRPLTSEEKAQLELWKSQLESNNEQISEKDSEAEVLKSFIESFSEMLDETFKKGTAKGTENKNKSTSSSSTKSDEPKYEDFNWIEKILDRIQRKVDSFSKVVSSKFKSLSTRQEAAKEELQAITKQIELQEQAYEKYMELANSIDITGIVSAEEWAQITLAVREGTMDISKYEESIADLIEQYTEMYEAALDCKDSVDDLHESLATFYQDQFTRLQTDFENRISLLEYLSNMYNTGISTLEANGYMASKEFYEALEIATEHNIELLKEELSSLESALEAALNSGEIEKYSEAWYEQVIAINSVKESIASATQQLAEFAKEMREIDWQYFDFMQERISDITAESEFLIDLLDNNPLFDSNGNMTNEGMSVLGLHAVDYNVYMAQADKYAEEIRKIEQELANDPYNTDLIERRQELLELQRQSILAAEDEKQALIDLVEDGIEEELDKLKELIDAYKDSLRAAKDLHDYEKKINDQTDKLAAIDKQIIGVSGDDSEEGKATLQKLYAERADALEDLQETEYDRYISEQEKLLDNLYEQYETLLNQRMDDVDVLISELISTVNLNSDTIGQTLQMTASSVGYTLTDSMQQIFSNVSSNYGQMQNIVAQYGQGFLNALTTTNSVLQQISQQVANMQTYSNSWANNWIGSVNNSYIPDYSGWTPGGGDYSGGGYNDWDTEIVDDGDTGGYGGGNVGYTPPAPKQITVGGRINAAGATIYRRSDRSDGGTTQYYGSDPIYTVLSQQTNKYGETMLLVRHHSLSSGNTGWFRMNDVRAYAKGGIVDTTGLAWLDGTPQKPESVLNPEMTKTFIEFNEGLQDLKRQRLSFRGGGGYDILPIRPPMVPMSAGISGYETMARNHITTPDSNMETNQDIDFNITIPIDHVENYDDLVTHMRDDPKFEKMMSDMILGRIYTNNPHLKYRTRWK